jgi:hypothetical protein
MSETKEQEPLAPPPLLPSDGLPDGEPLSDDLAIAKRMKQKSRNDAHLTAGCGYTTRKAVLLKAFWEEMWPELEKIGWQKVRHLQLIYLLGFAGLWLSSWFVMNDYYRASDEFAAVFVVGCPRLCARLNSFFRMWLVGRTCYNKSR